MLTFFFNDPPTTEIYTLSLHDALPISRGEQPAGDERVEARRVRVEAVGQLGRLVAGDEPPERSEEHTSELQSLTNLVCRLLLEKKKDSEFYAWFPQPPRPIYLWTDCL